jgi:hypothetical protein
MARRRRVRRLGRTIGTGLGRVLLLSQLLSTLLAVGLLAQIGPPPHIRVDALWVQSHRTEVRLVAISIVIALAIAAVLIASRRFRGGAILLAVGLVGTLVWPCAARVTVIGRVILEHLR